MTDSLHFVTLYFIYIYIAHYIVRTSVHTLFHSSPSFLYAASTHRTSYLVWTIDP